MKFEQGSDILKRLERSRLERVLALFLKVVEHAWSRQPAVVDTVVNKMARGPKGTLKS
jgi:hypothetical protein